MPKGTLHPDRRAAPRRLPGRHFTARGFARQSSDGEYKEVPTARITMGIASPLSGDAPATSAADVFGRQPPIYDRDGDPRQPAL